jgi:hypothetical protein
VRTGRAVHEHALGRRDPERLELVRVLHREHDRLHELLDLLVEPANVRVRLRGALVDLHRLHAAVELGGERVEDEVRVLVHADEVARPELVRGDEADDGQEDGLPGGGLDDGALALAGDVLDSCAAVLVRLGVHFEDLQGSVGEWGGRGRWEHDAPRRRSRRGKVGPCSA